MRHHVIKHFALSLTMLTAFYAHAANFYVDSAGGNDANSGSDAGSQSN